ncbi:hypothetical protein V8C37DRAFT_49678 [Trichoderma ceciliae]
MEQPTSQEMERVMKYLPWMIQNHVSAFMQMLDRFPLMSLKDVRRLLHDHQFDWNVTVQTLFAYIVCIGSLTIPGSEMGRWYEESLSESDCDIRSYGLFPEFCLLKAAFYGFRGNAIKALEYCKQCYVEYEAGYSNNDHLIFGYLSLVKSFNTESQQFLQDRSIVRTISFSTGHKHMFLEKEQKALLEFKPEECHCGCHLMPPSNNFNRLSNQNREIAARNLIFCILPEVDRMTSYVATYDFKKGDYTCYLSSAVYWIFEFIKVAPLLHKYDRLLYFWREYHSICFLAKCYTNENFQQYIDRNLIIFLTKQASHFNSLYIENPVAHSDFKRISKELTSIKV